MPSEDVTVPEETEEEPEPEGNEGTEEADASKTFENILIRQIGLEDGYTRSYVSPAQGPANVSVAGKQSAIKNLNASDLQVTTNVNGLVEGEHTALMISTDEAR